MFLQGDVREPQPGEDHGEHIQAHVEFLQSPFGTSMTAEKVQNVIAHIEATQALMVEQQQAETMMTQQQQGPPQGPPGPQQGPQQGSPPPDDIEGAE